MPNGDVNSGNVQDMQFRPVTYIYPLNALFVAEFFSFVVPAFTDTHCLQ